MESGEVYVVMNFHMPGVNEAFWSAMNAMTATGKNWSVEYLMNSETDNSGYWQAAVVKKG